MNPPDWTTLRIFLAAIELGSVIRAAERCGIAVTAAARRIQDLEADLGVRLLGRFDLVRAIKLGRRPSGWTYATSNVCTHLAGVLSDGEAVEGYVECLLHDGLFDIRTGKAQGGPVGKDLRTFPVRVEGTRLLVRIDGASDETARVP